MLISLPKDSFGISIRTYVNDNKFISSFASLMYFIASFCLLCRIGSLVQCWKCHSNHPCLVSNLKRCFQRLIECDIFCRLFRIPSVRSFKVSFSFYFDMRTGWWIFSYTFSESIEMTMCFLSPLIYFCGKLNLFMWE